ncbi:hypothetical protein [Streptomyces sp. NPDC054808]
MVGSATEATARLLAGRSAPEGAPAWRAWAHHLRARARGGSVLHGSGALADPEVGVASELAWLRGEFLAGGRGKDELGYELCLAVVRRPALRPVAAEWTDGATALLRPAGPRPPRALVALMDGICIQVVLTGGADGEAYAREMLGRVAGWRARQRRVSPANQRMIRGVAATLDPKWREP